MKYLSFNNHFNNSSYNTKKYNKLTKEQKNKWINAVYKYYNNEIPIFEYSKSDIFFMYGNLLNPQLFYVYSSFKNYDSLKKYGFNSLINFIKGTQQIKECYVEKFLNIKDLKFLGQTLIIIDCQYSEHFVKINQIADFYTLKHRLECSVFNKKTPNQIYKKKYYHLIDIYFKTLKSETKNHLFIKKLNFNDTSDKNIENSINPIIFMKILYYFDKHCTLFKPYIFKNIIEIFKTVNKPAILDLSSGWGDRLIGAISIQNKIDCYIGIDPNTSLHHCYQQIISDMCDKDNKNKFIMIDSGSENVDYSSFNKKFNIVFWSPPFYDQEHYVQKDNKSTINEFNKQSIEIFESYEDWEDNFFIKTLDKCSEVLEERCVIILYLGNINYKTFYYKMKKVINKHNLEHLGQFSILGTSLRNFIVYYKL